MNGYTSLTHFLQSNFIFRASGKLLNFLTMSRSRLSDHERYRVRLLLSISFSLLLLSILVTILNLLLLKKAEFAPQFAISGFITTIITFSIYLIARNGYYRFASITTIGFITLSIVSMDVVLSGADSKVLLLLILSVLLTSALLSVVETIIVGGLNVLIVLILGFAGLAGTFGDAFQTLFSISATTLLVAVVTSNRDYYQNQVVRQVGELKLAENALKNVNQQLEERMAETQLAKERAERADKVKSAFLASMSHELRTPLNAIINFTKFVVKGKYGPIGKEQSEALTEVIDSANHLLSLINDVLDMSKIESGSLTLFVDDNVALRPIIDSILAAARALVAGKPVEIQVEISEDLPPIRADKQRIRQILLNIISNACKFTEKGHIKLQTYLERDEVVFVVEDSGPGIAAEDQSAVFAAFKQTLTGLRQGGGTGLGMPISKNLAEAHGGRLWLESEAGKGATFYLALPLKAEKLLPTLVS